MTDPARLPGAPTPGPRLPGPDLPGSRLPEEGAIAVVEVSVAGAPTDATTSTAIGTPAGRGGEVKAVFVTASATDFDFNVTADGTDLFNSEQSPGSTNEERFDPVTENAEFQGDAPDLVFDVSSASAQGGASADVRVVTAINEQQ